MDLTNKHKLALLAGTICTLGAVSPVMADEPVLSGEVVMELQNEFTADSDDPSTDEYNNLFFRTEVAPTLQLNEHFYIDGVAVLEGIQDRDPNESNAFDNEGIFIEEIKLNYQNGPWTAWAGKFNPGFGIAWDFGRGIWGEDFAEDYEITEKLGFGGGYTVEDDNLGTHTFAVNTFFADTTFLSSSVITKRDKLTENDGGTSNTEDFSSFVISLEGENLGGIENLYYKLGYRSQSAGDVNVGADRETGYVITLGHVFPITEDVEIDALAEYADISNFDTGTDDNRYTTLSIITRFAEGWNVTTAYTARDIDVSGGSDMNDHLLQISGGYDFGQGTTAEIGWRNSEENNMDTDIIGGLIRHNFTF